ncbi:cytochrome c biogenesis heme-transporting ATPase CcmA [Pseudomonas massiliensis]|uniref:cytochrome c biogenesis heme-transporting ATPase CcmA n=1 Tax=Pseudomonas massiliensis TaxID=522492 RepID=UPI00058F1248|nr:cytochrome c biogenesis heme-transporting ATPase CcmA [Pseudomonas massiliensis]
MSVHLQGHALVCERDERMLFDGLNLSVRSGEMLKITGANGAGKTSLLRVLVGLMTPTAGEVRFNGQPLPRALPDLARHLLWLGHAPALKLSLTPLENLSWLCALGAPANRIAIHAALATVGLAGYEDQPCQRLSAGQRRRVALARLYLAPAPLWLLDEPFTALDAASVAALEAHLQRHCEEGGAVVLTSHHELSRMPARYRELRLGVEASAS